MSPSPTTKPRILPADQPAPAIPPESGAGHTIRLATCSHCGGKPLILRRCNSRRTCAVCSKCGFHHCVGKPM